MSPLAIHGGAPIRTKPFPAYTYIGDEEKKAALRVIDSGILSKYLGAWDKDFYGGSEVQAFEREWADYFKVRHAIAVNSCTSGLIAAAGAIGLEPGDEVIVSPYTMAATVTAPLWYGAIPVFADVEPDFFCLDPCSIEQRITDRTKAIFVVDIFGQPYDADSINAIAKKRNLFIVEDCAQASGAAHRGRSAGTLGDIGVYSLNYHKHIHSGEGGMVVTDNDELADRIRLIRNHAEAVVESKGTENLSNMIGFNFRLTEIQAAIGREQLKKLSKLNTMRSENCRYLRERLSEVPCMIDPGVREESTHVYYVLPFLFDAQKAGVHRNTFIDAVKAELSPTQLREDEGPLLGYGYVKPLYLMPLFQKCIAFGSHGYPFTSPHYTGTVQYKKGICPVVESLHEDTFVSTEFMRPPATREDLDDVVRAFEKVWEHRDVLQSP